MSEKAYTFLIEAAIINMDDGKSYMIVNAPTTYILSAYPGEDGEIVRWKDMSGNVPPQDFEVIQDYVKKNWDVLI